MKHLGLTSIMAALAFVLMAAVPAAAQQSQHEQIVEYYGGEYDPDGLGQYVRSIVDRLEPHANLDRPIRYVTVLDTPIVNAFATPEGGVYVTRGIIALANSEDELAGVIGHEIAHVAEAHGDSRQGAALITGIIGLGLQVAGAGDWAMLGYNVGANLGLSSYSRGQEADADRLGVRYLHRAGYDPYALADFFWSMEAEADLQRRMSGQGTSSLAAMEFFSTHPNTEGRIESTHDRARRKGVAEGERPRIVEEYMARIDHMLYGDSEEQGFIRGQTFYHPDLDFQFTVPTGYRLRNSATAVNAQHSDGSNIRFDLGQTGNKRNLGDYLVRDFAQELGVQLYNAQTFTLDGRRAANARGTAVVNNRNVDVFVVAYDGGGDQVYRFVMSGPTGRSIAERGWYDTQDSFRRMSDYESAGLHAYRVETRRVRSGDTVENLAYLMAFDDFQVDRFRTLNGLRRNDTVSAGDWVKIVVE